MIMKPNDIIFVLKDMLKKHHESQEAVIETVCEMCYWSDLDATDLQDVLEYTIGAVPSADPILRRFKEKYRR